MDPQVILRRLDSFDWAAWNQRYAEGFRAVFERLVDAGGQRAAQRVLATFDTADPFLSRFLTDYVGERIVQLDETTKEEVSAVVRDALAAGEGLTPRDLGVAIGDKVRETFADYEQWRADRIARTETAIALNTGGVLAFRQAGIDQVVVADGGTPASCEECDAVDGEVWELDEALANPVEHPNCTRAFAPLTEEEAAAYAAEE